MESERRSAALDGIRRSSALTQTDLLKSLSSEAALVVVDTE
jgi:hypothetical protein